MLWACVERLREPGGVERLSCLAAARIQGTLTPTLSQWERERETYTCGFRKGVLHIDASMICFDDMRTTVRLDEKLLAEAKKVAVDTGRTFTQVVEDALRVALAQGRERKRGKPTKLHTCGGNGLQPGVDLTNNAALQDLMDEHDGLIGR